jgi:hypothetical protein
MVEGNGTQYQINDAFTGEDASKSITALSNAFQNGMGNPDSYKGKRLFRRFEIISDNDLVIPFHDSDYNILVGVHTSTTYGNQHV